MPINEELNNGAIIYADLNQGTLGNQSRLATQLGGVAILTRTIKQIQKAKHLDQILVFCPSDQVSDIEALLGDTTATIHGLSTPSPTSNIINKRKWSLNSWRGGISEALVFDESQYNGEIIEIAKAASIYFAISIAPEASFVEPDIIDGVIEQYHDNLDAFKFSFAHTAPGLACCGYRLDLLHTLVDHKVGLGHLLAYDPDTPQQDFINRGCTFNTPIEWCTPQIRFIPDTQRHFNAFETLFATEPALAQSCTTNDLINHIIPLHQSLNTFPHEIEIEINTSPTIRIDGYPHVAVANRRPEMSMALFQSIIDQCRDHDDICITLGGFGEPLNHPALIDMIQYAHENGIFGINIETDGLALHGDLANALCNAPVDTISVHLDAVSAKSYHALKHHDYFDRVTAQIDAFIALSQVANGPMIMPYLTKSLQTLKEMEAFYLTWIRKTGNVVIDGYNSFCDQIADHAVMDMSSPNRSKCRRIDKTMVIYANGDVPICSQDFNGNHLAGNLTETTLKNIWHNELFTNLRKSHLDGQFSFNPLCTNCKEWHR
jgi:radical SAM protein with 4Fe4S-binding SPASM domain